MTDLKSKTEFCDHPLHQGWAKSLPLALQSNRFVKYFFFVAILLCTSVFLLGRKDNSFLNKASVLGKGFCKEHVQRIDSNSKSVLNAVVCGSSLPESLEKNLVKNAGLLHLLVVSGSHFLLLVQISMFARLPLFVSIFCVFGYLFLTGLEPPGFRFVAQWLVAISLQKTTVSFTRDQTVLLSGALCILFWPNWVQSFSFQLSWIASLSLSVYSSYDAQESLQLTKSENSSQSAFINGLLLFCFLLFPLSIISNPNPIVMISNFFLAPFLSILLFPLGLISVLVPLLAPLFDFSWQFIVSILELFFSSTPETTDSSFKIPTKKIWIYIFALHFFIHFFRIYFRRQQFKKEFCRQVQRQNLSK